jgi:tRNA(Glu) U13 pseudouridine synthase TruD
MAAAVTAISAHGLSKQYDLGRNRAGYGRLTESLAGAFRRVAGRLRLIHLYAWQSHLWNRAVARYLESITGR